MTRQKIKTRLTEVKKGRSRNKSKLELQIEKRFGVLPNFFRLPPETPEITANLWGFAQFAYLDNPLPSLFKERLFVYLSRFCEVRYCIARHVGFLVGLGHAAGDARSPIQTVDEIVRMLRQPFPPGDQLFSSHHALLKKSLKEMPLPGSEMEDAIFAAAGHVFLQTGDALVCLERLQAALGVGRLQYLILLLSFIRTAHYWTKVHPELVLEPDIQQLLKTQEALAECVVRDPQGCSSAFDLRLLDELPGLRKQTLYATNLLSAIVESSEDAIVSKNLNGVITSWNKSAERLFGYSSEEAIGQSIMLIIPPERHDEETQIIERIHRGERTEHFETVRVRKDGSRVDIALTISPIRDAENRVMGASKVARDISERKRTEDALRQSEARLRLLSEKLDSEVQARTREVEDQNSRLLEQSEHLRELSGRLLRTRDEERRHVARELHDSTSQLLAALNMKLSSLQRADFEGDAEARKELIENCFSMANELISQVRTVSYLLHPPLLDELGLASALKWFVEGFEQRSHISTTLDIAEDFGRLQPDLEIVLFRIVQESLTNIHRHASCKNASIQISYTAGGVSMKIRDDGRGISAEKLAEIRTQGSGVGIAGMRERLREFDGSLDIHSDKKGTRISVTLPATTAQREVTIA